MGSTEHQRQIIDNFVNSVYVFDDRVVLNFNFTDDAKTVTREEVLGSSAVDLSLIHIFSAGSPSAYRLKISCTIGAVSGSIWYSPVSYTHLDVYKRQG